MTLPLAHHNLVVALPVFAPAVVICLVLAVHHLRERRHWDAEDELDVESAEQTDSLREIGSRPQTRER